MSDAPNPQSHARNDRSRTMTTADLPAEKVAALAEVLRKDWHDGGMYARADFDPRWLDAFATASVQALAPLIAGWLGEAEKRLTRVRALLEPELDCARLGRACSSVHASAEQWCRACHLRAALDGER